MQVEPEFYGPLQYDSVWGWAGLALVVLTAAWYAVVFAATRTPRGADARQRPAQLTDLAELKAAYLERIDDVERDAASGKRSIRDSHQEISLLLRKFVRDATGVDAPRMTHADLAKHPLPAAASAVGQLYPAEFGPEPLPSVAGSAAAARRAVLAWN